MRGWSVSCAGALGASIVLAACGGGGANDVSSEASGHFPVAVSHARFPATQTLAQQTSFVIRVRNTGHKTLPDVAVTIENPKYGTAAQAFATLIPNAQPGQPVLASRSRPVWIVDQAPGPCRYSCKQGGPGGGATAYSNTWALGPLRPGHTAVFDWHLTAVQTGRYTIAYTVAAGLGQQAVAVASAGSSLRGRFHVRISSTPQQAYVNNSGQIVDTK